MQSRCADSANWPMKAKFFAPFRHHVRAVARGARHEECRHVGHHHRDGLGAGGGELVDLLDGHAQVVEPLARDLLAGRLLDGLAGVVAGRVGVQGVDPDDDLVLRLVLEVRLAVTVQDSSQLESRAVTMPPVTTLPEKGSRLAIFSM